MPSEPNKRTHDQHPLTLSLSHPRPRARLKPNQTERTDGRTRTRTRTHGQMDTRTNERTNERSEPQTQTQTHLHERRDAEQHVAPRRLDPREVALGRRHGGREGRLEDAHDEARDDLWRRARGDVGGVGGERGDSDA